MAYTCVRTPLSSELPEISAAVYRRSTINALEKKGASLRYMKKISTSSLRVVFATRSGNFHARETEIAYQVLRVDAEPKRSGVIKTLELNDDVLHVNFTGREVRKVRVGLTSFFDSLILMTETMKEFDGRAPVYSYY